MTPSLRDLLQGTGLVLCLALVRARTWDVPSVAAAAGFDAVYIDLEHTSTSLETASMLCAAAIGVGVAPLVRLPGPGPDDVARVLDGGAMGIIAPHVESPEQAAALVQAARFPPWGRRSLAGPNPVVGYRPCPVHEAMDLLNRETVVAVMVETGLGVERARQIAAVEGVDLVLLGPHDLAADLGIPGQAESTEVLRAAETVAAACRAEGKSFGIAGIRSAPMLRRLIGQGLRFVSAGTDLGLLQDAATARVASLRDLTADP